MELKLYFFTFLFLTVKLDQTSSQSDDYYKLFGINRDATAKEIRRAFKNLAVKLHPDKNKDDKDADATFIKLTRAYETLKDPESRKKYDLYGDDQSDSAKFKTQYHSYSYYRDQFGIYDDDPLIITLSKSDYEVNILDDNQAWFVNFYSPNCHHCHELAPTWRKLAEELEGVIRIGAVNCEDDFYLCRQLRIEAYPTLLYYEKESHLYEGQKYYGDRSVDALKNFLLSKIKVNIKTVDREHWNEHNQKTWILFLCADGVNCPEQETMIKLAASLEGLMSFGIVEDKHFCEELSQEYRDKPIIVWHVQDRPSTKGDASNPIVAVRSITGSDAKEILDSVLEVLPNPEVIDDGKFKEIRTSLRSESEKPWLFCFYMGTATELNLQLKRLPPLIPDINMGLVHCGKSSVLCTSLHVARYPAWGVLKVGGAFELHHGRDVLHEVATFAKDGVKSTNMHALSPADLINLISEGTPWFVDWYAPWCPPCRKLMPELRKASQQFSSEQVQFGTIDCTLHRDLCAKYNIRSYPTTILYNQSQVNVYHNVHDADGISEFLRDMLNPTVINLDETSFIRLMRKPADELWVVDFYAPWCGPCQKLGPQWRKLSKQVEQFSEIKVAQVDCVANSALCDAQNIRSYPTVRLYPLGSKGLSTVALYRGNYDIIALKRWVFSFLPSPVEQMTSSQFEAKVLAKSYKLPVLADFYTPWCGPCVSFEPEFRIIAQILDGLVKSVKIDCEAERGFCGRQGVHSYPTVRLYLTSKKFYAIESQDSEHITGAVRRLVDQHKHQRTHDEL